MKFCKKCNSTKPLAEFSKDKTKPDGLESYCKLCKSTYKKQYRERNIEKILQQNRDYHRKNKDKELERHRLYRLKNSEALSKSGRDYYQRTLAQQRIRSNTYRIKNRDKILEYKYDYYLLNRDKELARRKEYRLKNREVITAHSNKRRAAKLNAIPSWANLEEIRKIYKDAKILTETTKVRHVVDHIVPLKGVNVSGLHVENNLRIVTWAENLIKSNKLIEELVI